MIAKDGLSIISGSFIAFILSLVLWKIVPHPASLTAAVLIAIFTIFNLFFFRDPERHPPRNPMAVISPADGKIVQIINVNEPEYFHREVRRISIFLSVFNVHVNRSPISGDVDYYIHQPGKFLAAFDHKASLENERTSIGIIHAKGHRVLFKQIAGLIARRIVCRVKVGEFRKAGERIGLIRYGSRVDVFLPFDARLQIKNGQIVKAGETILAIFPELPGDESSETKSTEPSKVEMSS